MSSRKCYRRSGRPQAVQFLSYGLNPCDRVRSSLSSYGEAISASCATERGVPPAPAPRGSRAGALGATSPRGVGIDRLAGEPKHLCKQQAAMRSSRKKEHVCFCKEKHQYDVYKYMFIY